MVDEKKLFLKALQEKFDEDPEEQNTKYYCYGGWEQSARKPSAKATSSMNTGKPDTPSVLIPAPESRFRSLSAVRHRKRLHRS